MSTLVKSIGYDNTTVVKIGYGNRTRVLKIVVGPTPTTVAIKRLTPV